MICVQVGGKGKVVYIHCKLSQFNQDLFKIPFQGYVEKLDVFALAKQT